MRTLPALLALLALAACATDPEPGPIAEALPNIPPSLPERAVAQVGEVDGSGLTGVVRFTALKDAVEIRYDLSGLSDGAHGFHVHQTGDCGADSAGTPAGAAGGHLNPLASPHGAPAASPARRHAGDLGNITAQGGRAVGVVIDSVLAFAGPTSIIGKAILIHGGEDDLTSQPSGDAGARVGCGVIRDDPPAESSTEPSEGT